MTPVSLMQPMVELESSKELFELVKKVYEEEGFGSPKAITVGGGSDSAYTTMVGQRFCLHNHGWRAYRVRHGR